MLRFLQMIFLAFLSGPAESVAEVLVEERWRTQALNRSLGSFAGPWDDLNRELLNGHPMLDSRFVDALLVHFGDGNEHLCQLQCGGQMMGMCILKPGKPGRWSSFMPPQAQVAPAILEKDANLASLVPGLGSLVAQVDLLCQDPEFSPALPCDHLPARSMNHALTMSIALEGSFEDYWSSRPRSLRQSMRTRDNRLLRDQLPPRLAIREAPGDMAAAVARFGRLESAGWKGRAGTAVSADNPQGPFYTDLLESFARTGQAVVYEYWLGERLAASQLAIASDRMLLLLKTTYDEDFATYSPGRLLLREVIRDGFSRLPVSVIEFYTNANPDQLAWATGQRWIGHVSLYRNPAVEQVFAALHATRRLALRLRERGGGLRAS